RRVGIDRAVGGRDHDVIGHEERGVPQRVGLLGQLGERVRRGERTAPRKREAKMHAPHIARGPGGCQGAGFWNISSYARAGRGRGCHPRDAKKSACARLDPMKPRILVVDDETVIAENLRLTLEREGHDVETAANTVGAMLRMETREFALAIVDLILPDGDGLHLLRLLKAKDPSIEVIIMTGHGSISKAVEATKQGAFYFVAKPFDADEMLMLVGKAL